LKIENLRQVLKVNGYPEAEIQHVGEVSEATFMIKIKSKTSADDVSADTKGQIIDVINTNFPQYVEGRDINRDVIQEIYEVGPRVGESCVQTLSWQ
jgi:preprotein translocase subunit SecF